MLGNAAARQFTEGAWRQERKKYVESEEFSDAISFLRYLTTIRIDAKFQESFPT